MPTRWPMDIVIPEIMHRIAHAAFAMHIRSRGRGFVINLRFCEIASLRFYLVWASTAPRQRLLKAVVDRLQTFKKCNQRRILGIRSFDHAMNMELKDRIHLDDIEPKTSTGNGALLSFWACKPHANCVPCLKCSVNRTSYGFAVDAPRIRIGSYQVFSKQQLQQPQSYLG